MRRDNLRTYEAGVLDVPAHGLTRSAASRAR
jgi:hypothetical protein